MFKRKSNLAQQEPESSEISVIESYKYCIDTPASGQVIENLFFKVQGWIIADKTQLIKNPQLMDGNNFVKELKIVLRPDVEAAYPEHSVLGFEQFMSVPDLLLIDQPRIVFFVGSQQENFPLPLSFSDKVREEAESFLERKRTKIAKIRHLLACAVCGSSTLETTSSRLNCPQCHSTFPINAESNTYNFLTEDLITQSGVENTENVSAHNYDEIAIGLIEQFKDGLILDNGSGLRNTYYPNVVNFEIVDYPTTDVLGVGENLPFQSNVFDAVFSLAVLEHVRDPFRAAAEIVRVLKQGGTLYVAVPFLQPFHGYPNHYYNMTSSGLKNLFAKDLEVVESGVPLAGLPVWCLTWFLQLYVAGLPAETAASFKNMKVGDLLGHPTTYLGQDFVKQLTAQANEELACVNYLVARKPLS